MINQPVWDRIRQIPAFDAFQLDIQEMADGKCILSAPHEVKYDGIFESFHGGLLMAIADMAACFAVMTLTGPEQAMATTDMNIRFLAPCLSDVRAEAVVIKLGKTLCPVHVDLYDMDGKKVALAQVNYIRLNQQPRRSVTE